MKILIADDSKTTLSLLTATLIEYGHDVIAAKSGEEALLFFQENRPDLIILDVVMPGMDGYECAKKIRLIDPNDWIPIIFLSASMDDESIEKGIDAGGDDYLSKPFSEITLKAKIKAMQRISNMRKKLFNLTQQLHLSSITDSLTGLYNRYHFDQYIKEKIEECNRYHHIIALLYIDLDRFKIVNDSLGHQMGDVLLKKIAKRLISSQRKNDFIARYGGDEFVIVISHLKNPDIAGKVAKKVIKHLSESYQLNHHKITIGASIGIAIYPMMASNEDELIRNADSAMYQAKMRGSNQYQYFTSLKKEDITDIFSKEHQFDKD